MNEASFKAPHQKGASAIKLKLSSNGKCKDEQNNNKLMNMNN